MTVPAHFFWAFFFQFAAIGVFLPYFGLFLQDKGFSGAEISSILIGIPIVQLVGNPIYGYLADTRFSRAAIYRTAMLTVMLLTVGFYLVETYWAFFIFVATHSFFRLPNVSILNAALMERLADKATYSRVRTGGSLGFVAFALLAGAWVSHFGMARLPDMLVVALAALILISWNAPVNVAADVPQAAPGGWRKFFTDRRWLLFLSTICISRIADTCYNVFYGIHLRDLGYAPHVVGGMWAIAVLGEVAVFWWSPAWLRRFRLEPMLLLTYAVAVGRWGLTAIADNIWALGLLQATHGLTFGLFYVVAVEWAYRESPAGYNTSAQSVTNAMMFGLSGIIGALVAGPLYDWGQGRAVFFAAAGFALSAVLLAAVWARMSTLAQRRQQLVYHGGHGQQI